MRFFRHAALGLGLCLALAAPAAADVWKCVMQTGPSITKGWIAPEIYVAFGQEGKAVQVFDGIIYEFNKKAPLEGQMTGEDGKQRKFSWSLFLVNSSGQRTKMQYQGTFLLASNELAVSARPAGYRDFFTARGSCKPEKG